MRLVQKSLCVLFAALACLYSLRVWRLQRKLQTGMK